MNFRIVSPSIPELANTILAKDLPAGFYQNGVLPAVTELVLELSGLPPNSDVVIDGVHYTTDSSGKVTFRFHGESDNVVVSVSVGGQEKYVYLMLRQYMILALLEAEAFLLSHRVLEITKNILGVFSSSSSRLLSNDPLYESDRVSVSSMLSFMLDDSESYDYFWDSLFDYLFSVRGFLGDSFSSDTIQSLFQNYGMAHIYSHTPISLFFLKKFFEYILNLDVSDDLSRVSISIGFLPLDINLLRIPNLGIVEVDYQNSRVRFSRGFLKKVLFGYYDPDPSSSWFDLPSLPDSDGVFYLLYSPIEEVDPFLEEEFVYVVDRSRLSWGSYFGGVVFDRDASSAVVTYDGNGSYYATRPVFSLMSYGYKKQYQKSILQIYEGQYHNSLSLPILYKASPFEYKILGYSSSNSYPDEIAILDVVPSISIPLFWVKKSGSTIENFGDINEFVPTDTESMSGVEVFITCHGDSCTDEKKEFISVFMRNYVRRFPSVLFRNVYVGLYKSGEDPILSYYPGYKSIWED